MDITPDTLDAIANRKKTWSEWQQRPTITYGEAVLALLNMGIAPADMSKIHDKLAEHIREAEIPDKPLLGGLDGFFWSVYNVIQQLFDPLSNLHTKVDLRTLMEAAETAVQKLNEQDQASREALLADNLTKTLAFIQSKFANDPRFVIDQRVPIAIRVGQDDMAKGLLEIVRGISCLCLLPLNIPPALPISSTIQRNNSALLWVLPTI